MSASNTTKSEFNLERLQQQTKKLIKSERPKETLNFLIKSIGLAMKNAAEQALANKHASLDVQESLIPSMKCAIALYLQVIGSQKTDFNRDILKRENIYVIEEAYFDMVHRYLNYRVGTDPESNERNLLEKSLLSQPSPLPPILGLQRLGRRWDSDITITGTYRWPDSDTDRSLLSYASTNFGWKRCPRTEKVLCESGSVGPFTFTAASFHNSFCRKSMEDEHYTGSFQLKKKHSELATTVQMFAVYDGHGGKQASEWLRDSCYAASFICCNSW